MAQVVKKAGTWSREKGGTGNFPRGVPREAVFPPKGIQRLSRGSWCLVCMLCLMVSQLQWCRAGSTLLGRTKR